MILPIKYPELTSYPELANELSIISAYEDTNLWISNSYINIKLTHEEDRICRVRLVANENRKPINIEKKYKALIESERAIETIEEALNNRSYCRIYLDRYYLKDCTSKGHMLHSFFIYGSNREFFFGADFIKNGKYIFTKVAKEDVAKSLKKTGEIAYKPNIDDPYLLTKIIYKKQPLELIFEYVKNQLSNFLSSIDENNETALFGISIYKELSQLIKNHDKRQWLDCRPLYTIKDHKKGMILRWKYLFDNGFGFKNYKLILEKLENVFSLADNCLYIALIYSVKKDTVLLEELCAKIMMFQTLEKEIYPKILDSIK